jgi:hypothetical protein
LAAADPLAELRALAGLLLQEAPSGTELGRRAGEAKLFSEVDVDEDEPPELVELVELELDDSVDLRVDQLRRAFGEPNEVPRLAHRPARVAFYVDQPGSPASVAIFASLDEEDEERVRSIRLRRDELGD